MPIRHTTACLQSVSRACVRDNAARPRASPAHILPCACFAMHRQRVIHRTTLTLQKHEPTTRGSAGGDATRPGPMQLEEPAAVLEAVVLCVVVGPAEEDAPELCVSANAASGASAASVEVDWERGGETEEREAGRAGREQREQGHTNRFVLRHMLPRSARTDTVAVLVWAS